MRYAQIDDNNKCFAVSDLSGKVDAANMIPIDVLDSDLLGRSYDAKTQTWGGKPKVSLDPTQEDKINYLYYKSLGVI